MEGFDKQSAARCRAALAPVRSKLARLQAAAGRRLGKAARQALMEATLKPVGARIIAESKGNEELASDMWRWAARYVQLETGTSLAKLYETITRPAPAPAATTPKRRGRKSNVGSGSRPSSPPVV